MPPSLPPPDESPPAAGPKEGKDSSCRGEQKKGTTRDREVTCSHVDATVLHRAYKSRHKTRVQPGADLFGTACAPIGLDREPEERREQRREKERKRVCVQVDSGLLGRSLDRSTGVSTRGLPVFSVAPMDIGRPSIIHSSVHAAPCARYIAFSWSRTQVCRAYRTASSTRENREGNFLQSPARARCHPIPFVLSRNLPLIVSRASATPRSPDFTPLP